MTKFNLPFEFVFDYLVPLDITVKPMFGLFALYVHEKIVLMLRQKKVNPEINGVWIATNPEHHKSLKNDFPSMRSISTNADSISETEWQLIPADTDDFEKSVIKVCKFIKHGDTRIGRIPIPGKKEGYNKNYIANQYECKKVRYLKNGFRSPGLCIFEQLNFNDDTKFMEKLNTNTRIVLNAIAITIFLISVFSCNKNNQINRGKTNAAKPNETQLADGDGNKYSTKLLMDGNLWMTSNLTLNIPNTYCYENAKENCEQYGRLYNWELAKQGCTLLGEGWQLPTKEEWGHLTMLYGRIAEDSSAFRKEAYKVLLSTGSSGFNAVLGGNRDPDGKHARLNAHGFYWTATEYDDSTACYYNFAKGSQALFQQDGGEKTGDFFSVRCVKHRNGSK